MYHVSYIHVFLGHAISLALSGYAYLTTRLALVVIPARVARGLLALLFEYVTDLSAVLAVLIIVAPLAFWLVALVVKTDLVAILAVLIVAAVIRTVGTAFACDTILVAWFALKNAKINIGR